MFKTLRIILISLSLVLLLVILGLRWKAQHQPPPRYWSIPPFHMTSVTTQGKREITENNLEGRPWIADFIFTSCQGPCPLLSATMARLQRSLPPEIQLVSFTVDPDHDTPKVLQRYAQAFGADPTRWQFIRGTPPSIHQLMYEGFRLAMTEDPNAPSGYRVTHSTKFVLVDANGIVRGFYDSEEDSFEDRIGHHARMILRERSSP